MTAAGSATKPPTLNAAASAKATLAAATLGFFVITLDAVVVNVALPAIGREFGASVTGLQWVVDGYALMFAAFLLSSGVLSDRVGARKAFAWGLSLFVIASIGCGLARSLLGLVVSRFAQGVGAAALMPTSMALIGQAYADPTQRRRAVAVWAMGGAAAATSGPMVGGLLALLDWRWIFFINVPAGLLTVALLLRVADSLRRPATFDLWGQLLAVVAMGGLTFGAIETGGRRFGDPMAWGPLIVALVALMGFVAVQRRSATPMLPSAVLASKNAKICVLIGFTFMAAYFGLPFLMTLYLQQVLGRSPFETGLAFLPMMAVGVLLTPFSARFVERWGARSTILAGLASMASGLFLLWGVVGHAPVPVLAALMVLVGIGGPTVAPPVTAVLLDSVPSEVSGTASGLFHTSRQLGGALAVAAFGALLVRSSGFIEGLRHGLLVAGVVVLLTAFVSLRLATPIRRRGRAVPTVK